MESHVHGFDADLHHASAGLASVAKRIPPGEADAAKRVLRSVLHALRDFLGPTRATALAAQLPTVIRGVYFEGFRAGKRTPTVRTKSEFLSRIAKELGVESSIEAQTAADAVLHTLWNHIDPGEVASIKAHLPGIATLWPTRPDAIDVAARRLHSRA